MLKTLVTISILLTVVLMGAALWWRYAARRRSLPCPAWLDLFLENPLANSEALRHIECTGLAPGMRVLDVGCGTGRIAIPSARRVAPGGEVAALDIQPAMLEKVARRAEASGLTNVRTVLVGIGRGEFREQNAFDRAFLTTVLGEIPNQKLALQEIFAALKPGGVLSITEVLVDPHYQSRGAVRRLCEEAGFRLEQVYGNVFNFTMNFVKPAAA
jgi:ubiquinone/menaquinone biosynthesis C-methylase UbiE